jgi:hypothetical protein
MNTIIAIDPGTTESALILWSGSCVTERMIATNEVIIQRISNEPSDTKNALAIEMVASYGMSVGREVFETCLWTGRFYQQWKIITGQDAILVFRRDVKLHLCGNMRAKDPNIRQAIIDRFGIVGTKKNQGPLYGISSHLWSALAIAVTALETKVNKPGALVRIAEEVL